MLKHVADILSKNKRGGDLCTRVGGDEFVVVLEDGSTAEHAKIFGTRMPPHCRAHAYQGHMLKIGASFGMQQQWIIMLLAMR